MPAAYQDENGKWFKQCSKTGTLFGPVDNKEDLSQWFSRNKVKPDGLAGECKKSVLEYHKVYYKLHPPVRKKKEKKTKSEQDKIYHLSANGLFTHYKRSSKKRGIHFSLTLDWFKEQVQKQEFNNCAISGIEFVNGACNPYSRSLDRIDNSKGYEPDNVKWICFKFNRFKSDLNLNEIEILYKYMLDTQNIRG